MSYRRLLPLTRISDSPEAVKVADWIFDDDPTIEQIERVVYEIKHGKSFEGAIEGIRFVPLGAEKNKDEASWYEICPCCNKEIEKRSESLHIRIHKSCRSILRNALKSIKKAKEAKNEVTNVTFRVSK